MFRWGVNRNEHGFRNRQEATPQIIVDCKAVMAELVAMTLFVTFGCGVACGNGANDGETRLLVAFAFGMGIMVLAYAAGHHSGGQINCAVTFSLVLGGQIPWYQGIANLLGQLLGSVLGACILCMVFPCSNDLTGALGTNAVADDYGAGNALVAEVMGTFLLCYVVWETAISPLSTVGQNACIAIGFAVFLAHLLLLPIDGCSINPTRSFGPAIISKMRGCDGVSDKGLEDLWIFWVGPLLGAALAALVQVPFVRLSTDKSDTVVPLPKP